MDSVSGTLLVILIFACLRSSVDASAASVVFIDSSLHQHLRTSSSGQTPLTASMSTMEVGATISVLLGLAPPPMLSSASSSKLNELLMPNPFARPYHVFMLEVPLAEDPQAFVHLDSAGFGNAIKRQLISDSSSIEVELPGSEEVAFTVLDGPEFDYAAITDKKISDFAQSLGGVYIVENSEPQRGELIIPFPGGSKMSLHMSKKADKKFAFGLMYLIEKTRKAVQKATEGSDSNVAQLIGGCFDGVKVLQEEYGSKDIAQQAIDLLLTTVSTVFDSLEEKYKGQIVGVILFSNAESSHPEKKILDVTFVPRPSLRKLEEVKSSSNSTAEAEVILVRRTLAWFTGIVLLIATLIGVYLLVNMPLTRDTLLYSNVKLD